jgi:hypothetical protein
VGDDADFQRAKSHGQQSHGGRKALQNVPGKWGRANNIHPKAADTQSQIQRKGRTLKPFTEVIVSRKVAIDNDFNNRGNQKKMPNQNTRGLQMYCQSYQQNLVRTSNRQALLEYSRNRTQRRQLQRGAKLLNPTSATGVLLCKKPGPATNNHCQNGSNTLYNAIHNAAKGTSSTWRDRGSAKTELSENNFNGGRSC